MNWAVSTHKYSRKVKLEKPGAKDGSKHRISEGQTFSLDIKSRMTVSELLSPPGFSEIVLGRRTCFINSLDFQRRS